MIKQYLKKILFLTIGLILRHPIYLLLFLLRPFKLFQYIFLVYPGKDKDIDAFCPLWLAKSILFSGKPSIAGIVTKSKTNARGLMLVVPNSTHDLIHNKQIATDIINNLNKIAKIIGSNTIGMAGQGPAIMQKHNIETGDKFMHGTMGTLFSISETIHAAVKKNNFPKNTKIVIVGKSFISRGLVDFLNLHEYHAFEINLSDGPLCIKNADIIIVLTLSGKLFYPFIPHIKDSSIVIDYTHPKMLKRPTNAYFYKVATSIDGVKFIPKLPGYKADWIPGCCIESIVHSEYGNTPFANQELFNRSAKNLGLEALLVR